MVTGYGLINHRMAYAFAQDFTVFGGSLSEANAAKICKIMDLALKVGRPLIGLNDSGGARIQEGVASLAGYADIFLRNTLASGVVPQISAVMGPCAGGAVYSPAITDFVLMVEKFQLHVCHRTGRHPHRHARKRDQGRPGRAALHTTQPAAWRISRRATTRNAWRWCANCSPSCRRTTAKIRLLSNPTIPRIAATRNWTAWFPRSPTDLTTSRTSSAAWWTTATSWRSTSSLPGTWWWVSRDWAAYSVGIVANQPAVLAGCLDIDASVKGARFVRFCDAFNIPLITFEDVPGFLPGTQQEFGGIIRHGAKLLYAFAEATVPKLTVITRKAYGGAYCVMSSKHIRTDVNLAYPTAEIAVMGPEGAVNIVNRRELQSAKDPEKLRKEKAEEYRDRFANPYIAAERGYVDAVIAPRDTRPRLIRALRMLENKRDTTAAQKARQHPAVIF